MEATKSLSLPTMKYVTKGKLRIPMLGLGTRKGILPSLVKHAVLNENYRLIDTAKLYENESQIGEALHDVVVSAQAVSREDLFVVSKLWNDDKWDVEAALKDSLKRLQLDYLDLYLIHWPLGTCVDPTCWGYKQPPLHKTWADMETCVRKGLCRAIGVSNFCCQLLLDMLAYAEIPPAVNEIELHPYCAQRNLVRFCQKSGIEVVAYGPLMAAGRRKPEQTNLLLDPVITGLAGKYGRTPGQICLQWGMANGHIVIPQTSHEARLRENMESLTFSIDPEDLKKIDALDKKERIYDICVRKQYGGVPIFE